MLAGLTSLQESNVFKEVNLDIIIKYIGVVLNLHRSESLIFWGNYLYLDPYFFWTSHVNGTKLD